MHKVTRTWRGYKFYQTAINKFSITSEDFRCQVETDHWLTPEESHEFIDRHIEELRPKDREYELSGYVLSQSPADWNYVIFEKSTGRMVMRGATKHPLSTKDAYWIITETIRFLDRIYKELEQ